MPKSIPTEGHSIYGSEIYEIFHDLHADDELVDYEKYSLKCYHVVEADTLNQLSHNITLAIAQGWEPIGAPTSHNILEYSVYTQAIWRNHKHDNLPLIQMMVCNEVTHYTYQIDD